MADSGAPLSLPVQEWGYEKLRVPALTCLPVERRGAGASFSASLILHALVVALLPLIARTLPPDPELSFQVRLRSSLDRALILRIPNRIYLPAAGSSGQESQPASAPEHSGAPRPATKAQGRNPAAWGGDVPAHS